MNGWLLAILCVVSYFLGNINFGKIIAKSKNVDLSKSGSGNLGATNMYRTMGAKLGYLTLLLDASKGIIPSVTGFFVFGGASEVFPDALIGLYACGFSAVLGHVFPVVYRFKGGKGIATTLGVFLVSQPIVTIVTFLLCFVLVWFVKYVSLASLIFVTVAVVWQNIFLPEPNLTIALLTFGVFVLTWYAHRSNISRLLLGKERETNIQAKLMRDKKKLEKLENKQDQKQEKIEQKEEKREIKQEKKELKQELKQEKKDEKSLQKQKNKTNEKA